MKSVRPELVDKWILRIGTGATGALIALMLLSSSGRIDSLALSLGFAALSVLFVVLTIVQVLIHRSMGRFPDNDDSSRSHSNKDGTR